MLTLMSLVVHEFGFTLDAVNWLGNCINLTFLPCAVIVPMLYSRFGTRRTVSAPSHHRHVGMLTTLHYPGARHVAPTSALLAGSYS